MGTAFVEEDSRTTAQLVAALLGETDQEAASHALAVLHCRGSQEEYSAAEALTRSTRAEERELGAHILGQLGWERRTFLDESVALLISLLEDSSAQVVAAAASSLGHRHDTRSVPHLISLAAHPDNEVRFSVAFALGGIEDEQAIATEIRLSRDSDEKVRNWATFGLGTMIDIDTPEIRSALWDRVEHEAVDSEVYGEAVLGLAVRGDSRVVEAIRTQIESGNPRVYFLNAAEALGDVRFIEPLLRLKEECSVHGDELDGYWLHELDDAIAGLQQAARTEEGALVTRD